jgi:enoyl-CoA hydratase/carnithine racemase
MLVCVDDAELGTPEILVGLWPMMISALIYRNVPRKLANELLYTGRRINAGEALAAGIVNRVVARAELDAAVEAWVQTLVRHPRGIVRMGRQALYKQMDMPFAEALEYLASRLGDVLRTEDAREGLRAFIEKRRPNFTGR